MQRLSPGIHTGAGAVLRRVKGVACLWLAVCMMLLVTRVAHAVPPGTSISNTALATCNTGGTVGVVATSNTVTITSVIVRSTANLEMLRYAPGVSGAQMLQVPASEYSTSGLVSGPFVSLPAPTGVGSGSLMDLSNPVPLMTAAIYHQGEPIFLSLTDIDQNIETLVVDTILVTVSVASLGDTELIRFTETGLNTGVFIGYIQTSNQSPAIVNNGMLSVREDSEILAQYADVSDSADVSIVRTMVDPYGIVFDSITGLPVDGVTLTLMNTDTGQPAVVYGDDGISTFPATIVSGGTVSDSSGRTYNFPPGGYRYPFIVSGNYQFDILPSPGYSTPSVVPTATLQSLPSGPFAIVDPGSRGEPFNVNPGPAMHIDIPADPGTTALWVQKTAGRQEVAPGDFLQYSLNIENIATGGLLANVVVTDMLPAGFRYQTGSLHLDGQAAPDPTISSDGQTLSFSIGDLTSGERLTVHYVVEIGAGTKIGVAMNRAQAASSGGLASNTANATVLVKDDFFKNTTFIMGRVIAGSCETVPQDDSIGLKGIRIYLEDGTFVITDDRGMYHFEGVTPGTHVVQMDLDSLPGQYEPAMCDTNNRFSGRSFSQFVDLQAGTMWQADFRVVQKPPVTGDVGFHLKSSLMDQESIDYTVNLRISNVPLQNLRLSLMLPKNAQYQAGSSLLDDLALPDPEQTGDIITYRLGDAPADWSIHLKFKADIRIPHESPEMITKCFLTFDTAEKRNQRTPVADNILLLEVKEQGLKKKEIVLRSKFLSFSTDLSPEEKKDLDFLIDGLTDEQIKHIYIKGYTDNKKIRARSRHIMPDNYTLSAARAKSVAAYLVNALHLPPSRVTALGMGPDEPVTTNATVKGRALNRRVEIQVMMKDVPFTVYQGNAPSDQHITSSSGNHTDHDTNPSIQTELLSGREIVVYPKFDALNTDLNAEVLTELDRLANDFKGKDLYHIYLKGYNDDSSQDMTSAVVRSDDKMLGKIRAEQVRTYLANMHNIPESLITVICEDPESRDTAPARNLNQRVEVRAIVKEAGHIQRQERLVVSKGEADSRATTIGSEPGDSSVTTEAADDTTVDAPAYGDASWIETAAPGKEWLWPEPGFNPPVPSIKVFIKHGPKEKLTLILNKKEVSAFNFDSMSKNKSGTVAVSFWRGVDLKEGDNQFEVIVSNASGNEIVRLHHTVHYSGPPASVELVEDRSHLVADGKTTPVIAVRLLDKDGYPARHGVKGEFKVDSPHDSFERYEAFKNQPLSGMENENPTYLIAQDGIALIKLQPATNTGEAVLRFQLQGREEELRVWLQPALRDWILVGLAEGTAGFNTVSGNMENMRASDPGDDFYEDGGIAFFAKGRIKGKWLLTMSYDSSDRKTGVDNGLFQTIDPDTYYTLYGDATGQNYDAASSERLYLKIERNQFYALFGDYNTGLTVTELSRYSRSMTGLKSELKTRKYGFNVFASDTEQAFVKDEIRGDGTSGLYRLSRTNIVINSDKVTIETRDRFRSEIILSSRQMTRHVDYNIDYHAGTLFFKEPIFSRDQYLNPIYIVVDYESTQTSIAESYAFGGRGSVNLLQEKLELGATYIHEDQEGSGDLGGADATFNISDSTKIKAEISTTRKDLFGTVTDGNAYLAEITHNSTKLDGTIYVRRQDEDFGLGQQNGSETGTQKFGADAIYHATEHVDIDGLVYRHYNLSTDAERDVGEVTAFYREDTYRLSTGLRHAEDRMGDGTTNRSDQIIAGADKNLLNKKLLLRLDHFQSLSGSNANPEYPTRTLLGADYKISDPVTLFAEQEFTSGEYENTINTRAGMKATPWTGGSMSSSAGQNHNENGTRLFANLGLNQTWWLNQNWHIDGGLDHSRTLRDTGNTPFNANVPSASGSTSDFTAVSFGTGYQDDIWSWNSRAEFRTSEIDDKWGLSGNVFRQVSDGLGLSAGAHIFRTDAETGAQSTDSDVRFGLAYRPENTRWIILDRLDFIFEEDKNDMQDQDSRRVVNNLNLNYKPNYDLQVSFQYGAKYVKDTFYEIDYKGYTDLMGIETRYDMTEKWDIGLHGRILHSWNADQMDYNTGISFGYNIFTNAWVSAGYNFTGFEDRDFSRAAFTAQGPFIRFRIKVDQESIREAVKAIQ